MDDTIIDGDKMLVEGRMAEPLTSRRRAKPDPNFLLVLQQKKSGVEARCVEMAPLLDLNQQFEALGYKFVRLERLDAAAKVPS